MSRYKVVFAVLVALALVFSSVGLGEAADKKIMIKIGTGFPGGLWYPASAVLAAEIEKALKEIGYDASSSIQSTPGVFNVNAVNEGKEMQLTLTTSQNQYLAYNGLDPFPQKLQNIRLVGTQEFMITQFVVPAASDIKTPADLKNKVSNGGKPASTDRIMMEALFRAYGMTFDDVKAAGGDIMGLGWDDAAAMMQDGHMHCIGTFGGLMPSIINLIVQPGVRFLSIDEEHVKKILADPTMQGFVPAILKAGTYEKQDYDVSTIAVPTTIVGSKDLPDDVAYAITKTIYESGYHKAIFAVTESKGWPKICNPEDLPKVANIPVHQGTLKYLKEKGIEVPGH
jgi:TRAP transporter TAXI family solute receptor